MTGQRDAEALPPHRPLTEYYAEHSRQSWVRRAFDTTARDYDRIELLMAFGSGRWYRRRALQRAGLLPDMQVLDVGTGTGLTAIEAARLSGGGANVVGVDPSAGMLAHARLPPGMRVIEGCAEALPAGDAAFDFLTMGFALRHVSDLRAVFAEFYRVLKPGGRICLLEITRPASAHGSRWLRVYMRGVVPMLARVFGRTRDMPQLMRYYWDSIEACVPPAQVVEALQAAGFVDAIRKVELRIFSEYVATKPAAAQCA